MANKIKILVVGLGNMGLSHAKAYHNIDGFEIIGLCSRNINADTILPDELQSYPRFNDYKLALRRIKPDAVSINTWPDTHKEYAIAAIMAGAHIFIEKPIAISVADAEKVIVAAKMQNKKLVIGYILRHHPSWEKFVSLAQNLGKPLVMRMNLNQQSNGDTWNTHKQLMKSISPIIDCGVHYVDMMCLMSGANPISVNAIGSRLSDEIDDDMYNYGQLQVTFDDGSIGWYESGWGPMMSETAFFIKDIIGPKGCVSIISENQVGESHKSDDMDGHIKSNQLRLHHSMTNQDGKFSQPDEIINIENEPDHDQLCQLEQQYFLKVIIEDIDLTNHMRDALNSMRIVFAADLSIRTGDKIKL